ncbi:hypothetical protein ACLB1G_21830 [Oxalobacteraceae bacterium A2-2]
MARARNIKPGLYKNEDLSECSIWARFIFPGLWMLADREGRLEDRPKRIKGELLAYDSVEVDPLLEELARFGFIDRYEVDGQRYIQILKFSEHQAPHSTERDSLLPDRDGFLTVHERTKNGGITGSVRRIRFDEPVDNVNPRREPVNPPNHNALIPDSLIPDSNTTTPDGVVAASVAGGEKVVRIKSSKPDCPHQQIIALYHEVLPQCPQIRDWTPARANQLRARWNEDKRRQDLDYWRKFFEYVGTCDFLVGRSKQPFFADLEWMTKPGNFAKIREGRYENRGAA